MPHLNHNKQLPFTAKDSKQKDWKSNQNGENEDDISDKYR